MIQFNLNINLLKMTQIIDLQKSFHSFISLHQKIKSLGLDAQISKPKIVIVGTQGCGKSQILESIIGQHFIPKNQVNFSQKEQNNKHNKYILELNLIYEEHAKQKYVKFQHDHSQKQQVFINLKEIKDKISQITNKKQPNRVEAQLIKISLYSCTFIDGFPLKLIQLPSLSDIQLNHSQINTIAQTKFLIQKYISQENAIITCVVSANQYIINNQMYKLIRKTDPYGQRSILCINNIDLSQKNQEIINLLKNKTQDIFKPICIGLPYRSQTDYNGFIANQQAEEQEKFDLFSDLKYCAVSKSYVGISALVQAIERLLQQVIINQFPALLEKVRKDREILKQKIKKYGKPLPKSQEWRHAFMRETVSQYIKTYESALSGSFLKISQQSKVIQIVSQIKGDLKKILLHEFMQDLSQKFSDQKIQFALKKYDTLNNLGFPSIEVFFYLITPILQHLQYPIYDALTCLCYSLNELTENVASQIVLNYQKFQNFIVEINIKIGNQYLEKSKDFILKLLQSFTKGIHFHNFEYDQLLIQQSNKAQKKFKYSLSQNIRILQQNIIKHVQVIPKNLIHLLLNQATKKLQYQLLKQSTIITRQKIDELLQVNSQNEKQTILINEEINLLLMKQQFIKFHKLYPYAQNILKLNKRRKLLKAFQESSQNCNVQKQKQEYFNKKSQLNEEKLTFQPVRVTQFNSFKQEITYKINISNQENSKTTKSNSIQPQKFWQTIQKIQKKQPHIARVICYDILNKPNDKQKMKISQKQKQKIQIKAKSNQKSVQKMLSILSQTLQRQGIKTFFSPTSTVETQLSLKILTQGFMDDVILFKQRIPDQCNIFPFNFDDLKDSQTLKEFQLLYRINIQKETGINRDNVYIHKIAKGSIKIQFSFMNLSSQQERQLLKNDYVNKRWSFQPFVKQFRLSTSDFDPRGNFIFPQNNSKPQTRGKWPYYQPTKCIRYGLKVSKKYDGGDDRWLSMNNSQGEWAVAFHGIKNPKQSLNSIMSGLNQGKMLRTNGGGQFHQRIRCVNKPEYIGKGAYCTPHMKDALCYTGLKNHYGSFYKLPQVDTLTHRIVLQCRVKPSEIRVSSYKQQYWVIPKSQYIRPYGIILIDDDTAYNYIDTEKQYGKKFKYQDFKKTIQS